MCWELESTREFYTAEFIWFFGNIVRRATTFYFLLFSLPSIYDNFRWLTLIRISKKLHQMHTVILEMLSVLNSQCSYCALDELSFDRNIIIFEFVYILEKCWSLNSVCCIAVRGAFSSFKLFGILLFVPFDVRFSGRCAVQIPFDISFLVKSDDERQFLQNIFRFVFCFKLAFLSTPCGCSSPNFISVRLT